MLQSAVFLLSLSSISYEILLARVFSISQWNHLSFMVISIALFGFAASGTLLSLLEIREKNVLQRCRSNSALGWLILLYTATGAAAFLLLNRMPLDYFRLPLEPIQAVYLLCAFLLLSLPFFFTGTVISLAYIFMKEQTGYVYFATMTGSACGAIVPVILLPQMGEGCSILLTLLFPLILTPLTAIKPVRNPTIDLFGSGMKSFFPLAAAGMVAALVMLMSETSSMPSMVRPSPYKSMSQTLQLPDSRIVETARNIRGRIDRVKTPYMRFAPGLSLKFKQRLPEQWAAFRDADSRTAFYDLSTAESADFARFTLPYLGYDLSEHPDRILVIHDSGGFSIPCAIASGAREITVIEQNPAIARMFRDRYPVSVICDHPRAFLSRTDQYFDIIQVESWGFSIPGTAALSQDVLLTAEAFSAYLSRLGPHGKIIFARKLLLPPADSLRLFGTAYEALARAGIVGPEDHLTMARNYDTFTLVISKDEIDRERVRQFARHLNFDIVYLHDMDSGLANRFNVFDAPFHNIEIENLRKAYQTGLQKVFFQNHLLDIAPRSDNRPFPNKFLKWKRFWDHYRVKGSRLYTLLMSGEVVVVVVFAEAFLVSFLLLVVPFVSAAEPGSTRLISQMLYFFSVGVGFMTMELYFIKAFTILFGEPIISLTVVLAGMLVFSGAAGIYSQRLEMAGMKLSLAAVSALLAIMSAWLNNIIGYLLELPTSLRFVFAFVLLLPSGVLAGLPFPLGMRLLLKTPLERAHAWTSNGCASVLSSIAAAQIAISIGIPSMAFFAASAYMFALICLSRTGPYAKSNLKTLSNTQ